MAHKAIPLETRSCKGCGVEFQTSDPRKWFHKAGCGYASRIKWTNEWLLVNRPNFPTEPCLTCGAPVVQYRTRRYDGEMRYCDHKCAPRNKPPLAKAQWPPRKHGDSSRLPSGCKPCGTGRRVGLCGQHRNLYSKLKYRLYWLLPRSCTICKETFTSWGKDKRCPHCKTLRERVMAAGDKSITLLNLYTLDEGRCSICLEQTRHPDEWKIPGNRAADLPSIDHIKPISKGGIHDWTNVALACLRCNILKSNRVPTEGRAVNGLAARSTPVPSDEFVNLLYGVETA